MRKRGIPKFLAPPTGCWSGNWITIVETLQRGPILRLNAESTEEFRVTTANGNANQGRSSGAQINIVTKTAQMIGTELLPNFIAREASPRTIGLTIIRLRKSLDRPFSETHLREQSAAQ